jgi:hypothetical protein
MDKIILISLFTICFCSCNPLINKNKTDDEYCAHPSSECSVNPVQEAPNLMSILSPPGATHISGDSINFDLNFDTEVVIIGSFSLSLKIGSVVKEASCVKFSMKQIRCSYTFQEDNLKPDFDLDGIEFVGFNTSSGNVENVAGIKADINLTLPDITNIKVHFANFDNWLDANDQSTLFSDAACSVTAVDGDNISCWVDKKSGIIAKSVGSLKPLYSSSGAPNSKGTLYFNIDHVEYPSGITIGTNYTLFVVYNVVTFQTLNYFIGSVSGGTAGIGFGFGGTWIGGPAGDGLFTITKANAGSALNTISSTTEPSNWSTATYTPLQIFSNEIEALPYSSNQPLDLPQTFKRVGRREDGNACCNHNGNIAEIMIFSQTLTIDERKSVWCYISDKYNLGYTGC